MVAKQSYSSLGKNLSLPLFSVLVDQQGKTVPGLACLSRREDFGSCFRNWLPGEGAGLPWVWEKREVEGTGIPLRSQAQRNQEVRGNYYSLFIAQDVKGNSLGWLVSH